MDAISYACRECAALRSYRRYTRLGAFRLRSPIAGICLREWIAIRKVNLPQCRLCLNFDLCTKFGALLPQASSQARRCRVVLPAANEPGGEAFGKESKRWFRFVQVQRGFPPSAVTHAAHAGTSSSAAGSGRAPRGGPLLAASISFSTSRPVRCLRPLSSCAGPLSLPPVFRVFRPRIVLSRVYPVRSR
jgi:hypothetical protein